MSVMQIKALREKAKMSQSELATRMGYVQSAVGNWESEVTLPKARDIPQLAKILGCSIEDLFVHESEETVEPGPAVSSFDPDPED